MDAEAKDKELRRAFRDIIKGYSNVTIVPHKGSAMYDTNREEMSCYAKHFGFFDQIELDKKYDGSYEKALKNELPTHEQMLTNLEESGQWTREEESDYIQKKSFLDSLRKTKTKLVVPSQVETVQQSIDKTSGEVEKMAHTKRTLFGTTCEDYATSQLNSQTIIFCMYKDEELTIPLFSKEDQEYLDNLDIGTMVGAYNTAVEVLSIDNIKKLSISSFFTSYFSLVEEAPYAFFNKKNVYDLTFYQLNLLSYGKVLRSIIRNTQPPEHIMEDADKLIDWSEKGEKARSLIEKSKDKEGFSVVGAKSDDYKQMGVERKGKSIFDMAKEKGGEGTLGIMDFIDK